VAEALSALGSGFAGDVASIIKAAGPGNIYSAVVSSQFDADRLDYMQRDRLMTGTQQGAIDFEWLLANIEVGEVPSGVDEESLGPVETFVLGPKAIYAAEAYVLGLFQLYPTVYLHKTTRGAEKLFTELLCRVVQLISDGSTKRIGLAASHPIVQFARKPEDLQAVLRLDDVVVSGGLASMAEAKDNLVAELAGRLRSRKFYKAIDVRETVKRELRVVTKDKGKKAKDLDDKIVERMCANIRETVRRRLSKQNEGIPRILVDQAERDPYKPLQESKGPLNQIRIRVGPNEWVDLRDRSEVVRAIPRFQLFRLYIAKEDQESRIFIDKAIAKEVANVAKA
jgi:HD superfamily phosphohydrolase